MISEYIWFDYSCVPQEDPAERLLHLQAIPDILARCRVKAYIPPSLKHAYLLSVWCQLEAIASGPMGNQVHEMTMESSRKWTMTEASDLEAVLPGFICMVCGSRYRFDFFFNPDRHLRSTTLSSILSFFVEHQKNNHSKAESV